MGLGRHDMYSTCNFFCIILATSLYPRGKGRGTNFLVMLFRVGMLEVSVTCTYIDIEFRVFVCDGFLTVLTVPVSIEQYVEQNPSFLPP